jgi:hypothetical protein
MTETFGEKGQEEVPSQKKCKETILDWAASQHISMGDNLAAALCETDQSSLGQANSTGEKIAKYPKDYLLQTPKVGVPPELPDSERDVKMMKYSKALDYYEKIVGHEQKSYGWFVDLEIFGAKVKVNVVMACLLKELEARCKTMGMEDLKFKTLFGFVVKGGFHDYGMAIDFDARDHWLQKPGKTKWNMPMAMALELQKMGFKWGMYFHETREDGMTDSMHFEYRGTIEDAIRQLRSPEAIQIAQTCVLPKWRFKGKTLYEYALRDVPANPRA